MSFRTSRRCGCVKIRFCYCCQNGKQRQKFGFREIEVKLVGTQMLLWRHDNVHGRHFILVQAKERPKDTLDAISGNGVPAFFCHGKTKPPSMGSAGAKGKYHKVFRKKALTTVVTG